MKKRFLLKSLILLFALVVGCLSVWADDYDVTYNYSDLGSMISGSKEDASSYWKVPASAGNTATIAIPITVQPTSDITITFNIATFGSGTNPSSSNTTITAVGTEDGSNWSGSTVSSYPTSSTYVNGVMTITKPVSPTTLGGLTITMGVNSGIKIFRLKSIRVQYDYAAAAVTTPTFSPAEGTYTSAQSVTISCATVGATIYYTLDGSTPTSGSSVYSSAISVSETKTIKAMAKKGDDESLVGSATYTILHAGTALDPFTALDARNALTAGIIVSETDYYVKGIIAKIGAFSDGQLTYWISDDGTMTNNVQCYKGKNVGGAAFAGATDLEVGDIATVKGKLTIYSGTTYEFTENNEVVSITPRTKVNITTYTATTNPLILGVTETTTTSVTNDQVGWTPESYTYESDAVGVATVDASGVVTAVSKGTAHITVTADVAANNPTYKVGDSKSIEIIVSNPSHTAYFSVNGVIDPNDNDVVEEGEDITFPDDPSSLGGKAFVGWVATQIVGTTDEAPSFVSSPTMSTSDITYYAVFASSSSTTGWRKLAASEVSEAGTYALLTTDGHAFKGTINNSGHGETTTNAFVFTNNVATTAPAGTCEITLTISEDGFTMYDATNKYLYASAASSGSLAWHDTEDNMWKYANDNWEYQKNYSGNKARLRSYNNNTFRTYSANNGNVLEFAHKTSINIYSAYCTFFIPVDSESHEMTEDITIPEGVTYTVSSEIIIPEGIVLTVNGTLENDAPANLVIEDGGQLITNNSVKATIVRDITSASSKTVDDHWYTIASSVNAPTFASVTNLTTDGTYDLYRYDEASFTWQNSKKDIGGGVQQFTAFQNGRGYLYRKAGNEKIKYEGDVNVGNLTYTLMSYASENASVKGFNLIGNPFPHNIYKGYGGAIDESKLSDKFYYLDDNSTWQIGTYETPIKPGMGIMVQTNSTGDITIKDDNTAATAEKVPAAKSSVNEMMFTIANSQYKDAVYAVFDDGYGLYKLEHQNTEAPMAYITQNNKRYGSAMMSDDVRSFNLNFKAKTISQYTLSCKAFGEFDYVHVIDRLTGEDIDMLLEGEYNFVAAPEDMENRFIVKLGSNADNNENEVFVFQNGNDIVVNGEGELQIFDVTGRMISTQHVSGVETVSRPSQTGVYIFRIVGETVKTQKIVVE